jgi:exonuclease SbcD
VTALIIYGTGDLHIGQSMNYGKTDENGFPDKLREQQKLLADFVTEAINKADMVVFAGDYFPKHFRINPDAMRVLSEQILRLVEAKIPVKILEGNHDKARIEALDSTVQMFSVFKLAGVEVIRKPCVQSYDDIDVLFVPHLIPAELAVYQKSDQDDVTAAMKNMLDDLLSQTTKRAILFGHFGIAEAGRGSETTMIAGNNICVSADIFDRPELAYCFLGHIHKSWKWQGNYTNVVYFGSMDRFDFAEAKDTKEYGIIQIADEKVNYETIAVNARTFVDVKHYLGHDATIAFLEEYDFKDAVVKVNVEVDKDYTQGKKISEKIKDYITKAGAYHIHGISIVYRPSFVAKNSKVVESASVEDNLQRVILDEGFANPADLYRAHIELSREIRAEDEAEAEK